MKKITALLLSVLLMVSVLPLGSAAAQDNQAMLIITDYIDTSCEDVSAAIQAVIDSNPNRTIYFPDGTYNISHSILTPAEPTKSVDLQLSNYAVIKANPDFDGEALVRLGGKDPANNPRVNGSNYSLTGGILDGSGIADGVSIDSGRETKVSNVSIKKTVIGIHIKYGANSGSSDSDITDCNIIGNGSTESVGILIEGYDNTVTNVRIGNTFIGVWIKSAANSLTNIHPLYNSDFTDYENSCGFYDEGSNNIYNFCYSDQMCTAFYAKDGAVNIYTDCFAFWYTSRGNREIVFRSDGKFDSKVSGMRIGFRSDTKNTLIDAKGLGSGSLERMDFNEKNVGDYLTYEWYMTDSILYKFKTVIVHLKRMYGLLKYLSNSASAKQTTGK